MEALCFGAVLMVVAVVIYAVAGYRCAYHSYENWAMVAFLVFFLGGGLVLVGLEGMQWA